MIILYIFCASGFVSHFSILFIFDPIIKQMCNSILNLHNGMLIGAGYNTQNGCPRLGHMISKQLICNRCLKHCIDSTLKWSEPFRIAKHFFVFNGNGSYLIRSYLKRLLCRVPCLIFIVIVSPECHHAIKTIRYCLS